MELAFKFCGRIIRKQKYIFLLAAFFIVLKIGIKIYFFSAFRDQKQVAEIFLRPSGHLYKYLSSRTSEIDNEKVYEWQFPGLYPDDPNLGFRPPRSSQVRHILRTEDKIIYNVLYQNDQFGKRVVPLHHRAGKKFITFFGCSFVYGLGLSDDETLPYLMNQKDNTYNSYNYGISGSGPHMMLAMIQEGGPKREIKEKEGIFVYVYLDFHLERALGYLPSLQSLKESPYYYLDERDHLQRKGNFLNGRPLMTGGLMALSVMTNIIPGLHNRIIPSFNERGTKTFCSMIKETKRVLLEQFPRSKFLVYAHPASEMNLPLENCLNKNKVEVVKGEKFPPGAFAIPFDHHPTKLANEFIAGDLAKKIL